MTQGQDEVRTPRQSRSRETKEQILRAAEYMFRRHGYHGTNTKEIAKHAGAAVGSVYAYFRNKKDLYLEVLEDYSRKIFEKIQTLTIDFTPRSGRSDYFTDLLETVIRAHYAPELHRDLYAVFPHDPAVQEMTLHWQKEAVVEFQNALLQAEKELNVRDVEACAVLLHAFTETIVQRITIFRSMIDKGRLIAEFAVMLDRYLQGPTEGQGEPEMDPPAGKAHRPKPGKSGGGRLKGRIPRAG